MSGRAAVPLVPVSVRLGISISLLPCIGVAALSLGVSSPVFAKTGVAGAAAQAGPAVSTTILRVTVRSVVTGALISNAAVRLESDSELSQSRATDLAGIAVFNRSADRFEHHGLSDGVYNVIVAAVGYQTTTFSGVVVKPNTINRVDIQMAIRNEVVNVRRVRELIDTHETRVQVTRDSQFFQDIPLNAGNSQDLNSLLLSVPGVARDSGNRIVARGEDNVARSSYTDGFLNPALAQGGIASFLLPESLKSFTAVTGGFSAEYGGGSGLILDSVLRDPPAHRGQHDLEIEAGTGELNTADDSFVFGSRLSRHNSVARAERVLPANAPDKSLGYLLIGSQRYTDEASESGQDTGQTTRNYGASEILFGKFDMQVSQRTKISGVINFSSGRSDVINRLGLPTSFSPYGQGYGFAGLNNQFSGLANQEDDGQLLYQKDNNNLTYMQIDRSLLNGTKVKIGVGASLSDLAYFNNDYHTASIYGLPNDNSVEYLPQVDQHFDQIQAQIDITPKLHGKHQFKYGAVYQDLKGTEQYQYIPQSQVAESSLVQIDPRLGTQTNGDGSIYSPLLFVNRTGFYAGAYLQDTARVRSTITLNWGVRLDGYSQSVGSGDFNTGTGVSTHPGVLADVTKTEISPRINLAYAFPQGGAKRGKLGKIYRILSSKPTVARLSYDHMFSPPGMGQGSYLGNQPEEGDGGMRTPSPLVPQITDQYELNLERQIAPTRVVRLGIYTKDIQNYLQTEQLVPGVAGGMTTIFNQNEVTVDGTELTLDLLPEREDGVGYHGFLVLADSYTQPKNGGEVNNYGNSLGAVNLGTMASYLETDQEDTVTVGLAYKTLQGATAGLSVYYGSGLYSSAIKQLDVPERSNSRQTYESVNLRLSTGPRFMKKRASLQLDVDNLTNSQALMNFQGAFAGTRVQQGRRAILSVKAKF